MLLVLAFNMTKWKFCRDLLTLISNPYDFCSSCNTNEDTFNFLSSFLSIHWKSTKKKDLFLAFLRGGAGSGKVRKLGFELGTPKAQQHYMSSCYSWGYWHWHKPTFLRHNKIVIFWKDMIAVYHKQIKFVAHTRSTSNMVNGNSTVLAVEAWELGFFLFMWIKKTWFVSFCNFF